MSKRIVRIDPSSLALSDCSEKFRLSNLEGLVSKIANHKMDYGTGFHKGIAEWHKTGDAQLAKQTTLFHMASSTSVIPKDDLRQGGHCVKSVAAYCEKYKHDQFVPARHGDVVGVELPFMIPWKAYETCDVVLCGVVDAIGTWNNRIKVFKDIKTHKPLWMNKKVVDDYFASYEMSHQMMIYSWAIKQLGWANYYIPCIIDGAFIVKDQCEFYRSQLIEYRADQVEDCMKWVGERIDDLVDSIEGRKEWRRNFTQCTGKYGGCQFSRVCYVQEGYRAGTISSLFNVRDYDPCKFNIE